MSQRYAILLAFHLLALVSLPASAQPAPGLLSPYEVATVLRSTALQPISRPVLYGNNYVLRALDRYGDEVRVVVDGRVGRVRSITPLGEPAYVGSVAPYYRPRFAAPPSYYGRGPRFLDGYEDEAEFVPPRRYVREYVPEAAPRTVTPPRTTAPQTRTAARPPLPRSRPGDAPAATAAAPAAPAGSPPAEPEKSPAPPANRDGETPPPVGFE